jgi:hypothetical protein
VSEPRWRTDDREVEVLEWAAHDMSRPKALIDRSMGIFTAKGIHIGNIKYTGRVIAESGEVTRSFLRHLRIGKI